MAMTAKLYRSDDERLAERVPVEVDATLRNPANEALDVILLDLSTSGFRCASSETLAPGASVTLGLPGLGVNSARVVWRSGNVHGCEFDAMIPPSAIAAAETAQTVVRGAFPAQASTASTVAASPAPSRLAAEAAAAFALGLGWSVAATQLVQQYFVALIG